jgi:protein-tyrosine phosphatase
MVDLHSHILPAVDDGPACCEESVRLIKMELANGVDAVALTPHFETGSESVTSFAIRRAKALEKLQYALRCEKIQIRLVEGAEVFLSPEILTSSYKMSLCYDGTPFMLVELPYYDQPEWLTEIFRGLHFEGIIPVLAHVERYVYLMRQPEMIYDLVRGGALIQCNADALVFGSRRIRSAIFKLMEHHLVHVIATDAHSLEYRPPCFKVAMNFLIDRYGEEKAAYFNAISRSILSNQIPQPDEPIKIKKSLLNR